MNFVIYSRSQAGKRAPAEPHATISITTPKLPEAILVESDLRQGVLRLSFTDTGDYGQPIRDDILFDQVDAEAILRFADQHRHTVGCFVVHCEAGASRSPGVGAALCTLLGGDDASFFANYAPNRYVRRELIDYARKTYWPRGEKLIGDAIAPIEPITRGHSEATVAIITTEQGRFIRKAGATDVLTREARVLQALEGVTPLSPGFVGQDGEAFFQTLLPGTPLSEAIHTSLAKFAGLFGATLKELHALTPPLPPDPKDNWTWLQRNAELDVQPPVFSHGDWCLPNVLTDGESITGWIDWADGGWRDPRIDLGTGLWTLRYNLLRLVDNPDPEICIAAEKAFLEGYGFAEDPTTLEAFVKLYEA
ncbi:MAG: phosphotransferase [Armatimonas sp.]